MSSPNLIRRPATGKKEVCYHRNKIIPKGVIVQEVDFDGRRHVSHTSCHGQFLERNEVYESEMGDVPVSVDPLLSSVASFPRSKPIADDLDREVLRQEMSKAFLDEMAAKIESKLEFMFTNAFRIARPNAEERIVNKMLEESAQTLQGMADSVEEALRAMVADTLVNLRDCIDRQLVTVRPVVHILRTPDADLVLGDELRHEAFSEVIELLSAGFNVFLPGPTGAGKTFLCHQIAQALEMDFGVIAGTAGTTESELLGSSYPNLQTGESVYHQSDFIRIYENGGVFLIDEGDAMDPNLLLKINAAVANGFCPVPKRFGKTIAHRHPKFMFCMAANTWGQGATRTYCGRNRLDEATLDRFRASTVPVDYSRELEYKLCPDPELIRLLHRWRERIFSLGLQRVLSTRFIEACYRLKHQLGKSHRYIAERLTGGWTAKEISDVVGDLSAL
jgi:MoxR-like ATPase